MSEQTKTTDWQNIDTAPREPFVFDQKIDHPDLPGRLQMGPEIMLRGTLDGEVFESRAAWSVWEGQPGHWFDTEGEEPIDWPMTEWRHLTDAEQEAFANVE